MSEEIDSTTTGNQALRQDNYSNDVSARVNVLNASDINRRVEAGGIGAIATSSIVPKRKFSNEVDSCDAADAKRQRSDESDAANSRGNGIESSNNDLKVVLKREIKDEPQYENDPEPSTNEVYVTVKTEIKDEPEVATREEATSSIRDSCQYGIKCYRDDATIPTSSKKQWTSKDIRKMLKMVEERPVIWQVDYSDRTSRPQAFLEIEKELGFPALEVKRKLHNMRCTFRNQFKSSQFNNRPVKWKFFDAMKFMYSSAMTGDGADPWDDDFPMKSTNQSNTPKVIVPWKKRIREPHNSNHSKQQTDCTEVKFPFDKSIPIAYNTISNEEQKTEYNAIRDDCNIFGDYVADSIRNLPDDLKELAKRQITHLLFDICAHTDSRQVNIPVENVDTLTMEVAPTDVVYTITEPDYGMYPQTVLNETREIQLGLHEF